jgi:carotenoid cleavage dioxygenase-like enzyme
MRRGIFAEASGPACGVATVVAGTLPTDLAGTVLRCGPGSFRVGADRLGFFDAHGLVAGVSFADGRAWWRAALPATPALRDERAAGRLVHRRIFRNLPGGWLRNAFQVTAPVLANHDVLAWRGQVLATDGAGIVRLDPSLQTIGGLRLDPGAPRSAQPSPMPQRDPRTGRLIGYTLLPGGLRPDQLGFFELDVDGTGRRTPWVTLGGSPAVVHGHAFTERWYGVVELPLRLATASAVLGFRSIYGALKRPAGGVCHLILVPRGRPGPPVRVPLPDAGTVFHLVDGFDDGERVVFDAVVYDGAVPLDAVGPDDAGRNTDPIRPLLVRYAVDPARRTVDRFVWSERPTEAVAIDPRVRGQGARFAWGPVPGDDWGPNPGFYGYFQGIARFDAETGEVAEWQGALGDCLSPPVLVPREGAPEGEGWLLAFRTSPEHSSLLIFDAAQVDAGPVAELATGEAWPGVSHARFADDIWLDPPG